MIKSRNESPLRGAQSRVVVRHSSSRQVGPQNDKRLTKGFVKGEQNSAWPGQKGEILNLKHQILNNFKALMAKIV